LRNIQNSCCRWVSISFVIGGRTWACLFFIYYLFIYLLYFKKIFFFFFNKWKRPSSGTLFICTRIELTLAPFSNYPRKAGLEPWILDPQLQKKNKKKQKKKNKKKENENKLIK